MNYYQILGIERSASTDQIKAVYRRLAMKYHPDKNPGDKQAEEQFKQISEAYAVLSDPKKRAQFDQFGAVDRSNINLNDIFRNFGFGGLGDLFGDFFGASTETSRAAAGDDIEQILKISFREAVLGANKTIKVNYERNCHSCGGAGGDTVTCTRCAGRGSTQISHGFISLSTTCSKCGGTGRIISKRCSVCKGGGTVKELKKITIKIPAGIDNGHYYRLNGYGHAGNNGGHNGDLYLKFSVANDTKFIRDGNNIILHQPISLISAVLGDTIDVETIYGYEQIKIPAGTDSGEEFILRGKGIRGGNQIIRIFVETPKNLTAEAKKRFKEFAELYENTKNDKDIIEKIKTFFKGTLNA